MIREEKRIGSLSIKEINPEVQRRKVCSKSKFREHLSKVGEKKIRDEKNGSRQKFEQNMIKGMIKKGSSFLYIVNKFIRS